MHDKTAAAGDWTTSPMPEMNETFTFCRSFTPAQMELIKKGNIPESMEDKWFRYYEDDKLYIHHSWTGFCIYVVTFFPGSDVLSVCVNRDPEQYRCTDKARDMDRLNEFLTWWTMPGSDPYDMFVSETARALKPLMKERAKPSVAARMRGCVIGGAAGDALGYPVEMLSLDEIREKYGPEGIRYYNMKNGAACFSDDTQMLLFTLHGIVLWREKLRMGRDGAKLKNSLYLAYRDWLFTQKNDSPLKEKHRACTRLYLDPAMHVRRGPGFTCIRALRKNQPGSIRTRCNDSKGNGGVMRVAPIGFCFSRDEFSMEEVMYMGAESAALTHGHPLGYISAAFMAGIINECVYGDPEDLRSAVERALDNTMNMFSHEPESAQLDLLVNRAMELSTREGDSVEHIAALGHSACAESTMAIALYCALRHEDDFAAAIRTAVNFNGDSDTVAAVAGNILGAWHGEGFIDMMWKQPLHMEKYLDILTPAARL